MTSVHQLVPFLVPGDAISRHTLRLRDGLRAAGFESDIVAEVTHRSYRGETVAFVDAMETLRADLLIYQASTGSVIADWLARQRSRLLVNYHNITPPSYFEAWDVDAAANMRRARQQLRRLAPRAVAALAVSSFNAGELEQLGFRHVSVAPLLLSAFEEVTPDPAMADYLSRVGAGVHWLSVGRIVPNKCQHDVIGAFAVYRDLFDPDARLTLVGASSFVNYEDWLLELVERLELETAVTFAGAVTDAELVAIYRSADVFVCLSEHEGFGLPLVEAMQLGVPIVAAARAAVPDTVCGGGLVIEEKDPLTVATAVDALVTDQRLRDSVAAAARDRLAELSEVTEGPYIDAVRRVVGNGARGRR
jgi:glycosyltransferase involved in cell wall biosynthesis